MKKLVEGVLAFRRDVRPRVRDTFARLAFGQAPDALLLTCSDSRVAVNVFASTEPGDVFVVRNVGNFVPPAASGGCHREGFHALGAAVEFATMVLKVRDVIVCGHSGCGAVRALLEGSAPPEALHLRAWLENGRAALGRANPPIRGSESLPQADQVSQGNVLQQMENLRTYPAVRDREATGALRLHGWWFDIGAAEVRAYGGQDRGFVPIDDEEGPRILSRLEGRSG